MHNYITKPNLNIADKHVKKDFNKGIILMNSLVITFVIYLNQDGH